MGEGKEGRGRGGVGEGEGKRQTRSRERKKGRKKGSWVEECVHMIEAEILITVKYLAAVSHLLAQTTEVNYPTHLQKWSENPGQLSPHFLQGLPSSTS